jgi:hypothetical protein
MQHNERHNEQVAQLVRDLDKAPSGEAIIEHLLTAQIKLQRENKDLKAMIDALTDQIATLVKLVDGHQVAIQLLQAGSGGIIN